MAAVGLAFALTGCTLSPELTETTLPTHRQFPNEAAELRHIVNSMSDLSSTDSDELAIAWEDLESDLLSVSADLERDAGSMELDGVVRRIESFREQFNSSETMQSLSEQWDQLVLMLSEVSERSSS